MGVISLAFVLAAVYFVWSQLNKPRRSLPLPPGPKPLPLVGNIADLTARELWLRTKDWASQYGEWSLICCSIPVPRVAVADGSRCGLCARDSRPLRDGQVLGMTLVHARKR